MEARDRKPDVPDGDAIAVDVRMAALLDVSEIRPVSEQKVSRHAAANGCDAEKLRHTATLVGDSES
jgi:hypothetical protein